MGGRYVGARRMEIRSLGASPTVCRLRHRFRDWSLGIGRSKRATFPRQKILGNLETSSIWKKWGDERGRYRTLLQGYDSYVMWRTRRKMCRLEHRVSSFRNWAIQGNGNSYWNHAELIFANVDLKGPFRVPGALVDMLDTDSSTVSRLSRSLYPSNNCSRCTHPLR